VQFPALPTGSAVQVPFTPAPAATEHAAHPPAHAVLQQAPSAQCPEAHWGPEAHGCPLPRSAPAQVPPAQSPDAHWPSLLHEVPLACLGTQAPPAQ
jgi:hypothetical protein